MLLILVRSRVMSFVRVLVSRVGPGVLAASRSGAASRVAASSTSAPLWRGYSSKAIETDEEFDQRWVNYFNREDIDAWELKKGLNDLYGHDLVPEPKIVSAMLRAARRLNDVAMAVRILEAVKEKAAGDQQIYSYILQEIKPTMEELGIATPEELGLA